MLPYGRHWKYPKLSYGGAYSCLTGTTTRILNLLTVKDGGQEAIYCKSVLKARPVYVRKTDHIQSHFLICFTALVIARLLECRIERRYSVKTILESLRQRKLPWVGLILQIFNRGNIAHFSIYDIIFDMEGGCS